MRTSYRLSLYFFEFVKTHIMSHLIEDQIVNLRVIINGFLDEIINISRTKLEEEGAEISEEKVFNKMQETLIYFDHLYSSAEKCAEFKDYTIENFNKYATTVITEITTVP